MSLLSCAMRSDFVELSILPTPDRLRPAPSLIGVPAHATQRSGRHQIIKRQMPHMVFAEGKHSRGKSTVTPDGIHISSLPRSGGMHLEDLESCCVCDGRTATSQQMNHPQPMTLTTRLYNVGQERMVKEKAPSCSMLPFFLAAEPPASTPDTPLIVDMLLAALCSGLPEPGVV